MGKRLSVAAMTLVGAGVFLPPAAPCSASTTRDLAAKDVTVTAAHARGNSAVVMSLTNRTSGPISLISVTSPRSRLSMIDYDTNMCQGNNAMMRLANILILGGYTQKLGYSYQGAMLRQLKVPLEKGETVPLVITWSNFQKPHTMTVEARVVAAPKHINFGMTSMDG